MKETLRVCGYVRYVDDFLLFDDDKRRLHELRVAIEEFLLRLCLRLHPRKCFVSPVTAGVTFLGYPILRHCGGWILTMSGDLSEGSGNIVGLCQRGAYPTQNGGKVSAVGSRMRGRRIQCACEGGFLVAKVGDIGVKRY